MVFTGVIACSTAIAERSFVYVQELLKSMSLTGGLALPSWALFYFIGTCLWAFYRAFPDPRLQNLPPDAVFPNFILHELPPGVSCTQ